MIFRAAREIRHAPQGRAQPHRTEGLDPGGRRDNRRERRSAGADGAGHRPGDRLFARHPLQHVHRSRRPGRAIEYGDAGRAACSARGGGAERRAGSRRPGAGPGLCRLRAGTATPLEPGLRAQSRRRSGAVGAPACAHRGPAGPGRDGTRTAFSPSEARQRDHAARVLWSATQGITALAGAGKLARAESVDGMLRGLIIYQLRGIAASSEHPDFEVP